MAKLLNRWPGLGRSTRSRLSDERGAGIITALMVGIIVTMLGVTWSQLGLHNVAVSSHERSREETINAAEAGVNDAMSELTLDADYAGGQASLSGDGDFDVEVHRMSPDPEDMRRLIRATGYSPNRDDPTPVIRRYEAEVELKPRDGFEFALFAGAGVLDGDNRMTVTGDVYGKDGVDLNNNSDIYGDVISPQWVNVRNNTLITGDIQANGNVSVENSQTTVQGSVFARGNVYVNARIRGDVQAGGSITFGPFGVVEGNVAPSSPPPPVREESLPEFTWDEANYSPAPTTWSSTAAFRTAWHSAVQNNLPFSGHHRITDTATLILDRKWDMDGDVTIVSDGKIELRSSVVNVTNETVDLVVVSFSQTGIELSNQLTLPDSIRVLLFAPEGPVDFNNLKHFSGAVYGKSVDVDQNFTLTWTTPEAPGFSWVAATDVHYRVVLRVLREMTVFSDPP